MGALRWYDHHGGDCCMDDQESVDYLERFWKLESKDRKKIKKTEGTGNPSGLCQTRDKISRLETGGIFMPVFRRRYGKKTGNRRAYRP